jgi:hypothetical protein
MTQEAATVVSRQIVARRRSSARSPCSLSSSATSSRRSTIYSARRSPRPSSSRESGATSTTARSMAASAAGLVSSSTNRRTAWCSAGTSVRSGRSSRTRTTRGRGPLHRRDQTTHTGGTRVPQHRPTWPGLAIRRRRRCRRRGMAAVPRPVRRLAHREQLTPSVVAAAEVMPSAT